VVLGTQATGRAKGIFQNQAHQNIRIRHAKSVVERPKRKRTGLAGGYRNHPKKWLEPRHQKPAQERRRDYLFIRRAFGDAGNVV